jgi:hypothetical protein
MIGAHWHDASATLKLMWQHRPTAALPLIFDSIASDLRTCYIIDLGGGGSVYVGLCYSIGAGPGCGRNLMRGEVLYLPEPVVFGDSAVLDGGW